MSAWDHPAGHVADRPICEAADDVYLPTGVDLGPCTENCPKHGNDARRRDLLRLAAQLDSFTVAELQELVRRQFTTDLPSPHSTPTHVREWLDEGLVRRDSDRHGNGYRYWWRNDG